MVNWDMKVALLSAVQLKRKTIISSIPTPHALSVILFM